MPEVTVNLPEPPEELEWKQIAGDHPMSDTGAYQIVWRAVPKSTEWVNVKVRRVVAESFASDVWVHPDNQEVAAAMREALAEKSDDPHRLCGRKVATDSTCVLSQYHGGDCTDYRGYRQA